MVNIHEKTRSKLVDGMPIIATCIVGIYGIENPHISLTHIVIFSLYPDKHIRLSVQHFQYAPSRHKVPQPELPLLSAYTPFKFLGSFKLH